MTLAGGLRGLVSSLLKKSASAKQVEVQAEIKKVRSSPNRDLNLSLFGLLRPIRSIACLPVHQMVSRKKRDDVKDRHDGGQTVECSPDFSEEERDEWYSRIGIDHVATQNGGTFPLGKKTALQ
jgi:hypothetical protein